LPGSIALIAFRASSSVGVGAQPVQSDQTSSSAIMVGVERIGVVAVLRYNYFGAPIHQKPAHL